MTQVQGKWVEIGELFRKSRILRVHRNRETDLMKIWTAYGFDNEIMQSDLFDHVHIVETVDGKKQEYLIPRFNIVKEGKMYEAPGYERQIFIPIERLQDFSLNKDGR